MDILSDYAGIWSGSRFQEKEIVEGDRKTGQKKSPFPGIFINQQPEEEYIGHFSRHPPATLERGADQILQVNPDNSTYQNTFRDIPDPTSA